jgi:hypothetical protein
VRSWRGKKRNESIADKACGLASVGLDFDLGGLGCMPGGHFSWRTSENSVMKLSEKGFEQASERGFGRCSVPKSANPDPREAPVRAPPGLFRQFHGDVRRIHLTQRWLNCAITGSCLYGAAYVQSCLRQ